MGRGEESMQTRRRVEKGRVGFRGGGMEQTVGRIGRWREWKEVGGAGIWMEGKQTRKRGREERRGWKGKAGESRGREWKEGERREERKEKIHEGKEG